LLIVYGILGKLFYKKLISIVVNHYNFYIAVVIVFIGQFITMISRPIGRIIA